MFVEKLKSEGLAHLSYLVGDRGEAAVVDPRRDCEVYVRLAAERGCRIAHVFETHRNEDLVSGAPVLAEWTGAAVHHGPNAAEDVRYADVVREGDRFALGRLRVEVLETPGHTDDSLSFVLVDEDAGDDAVGVFTGDALFVGDVGRTDFYPDRAEEVAGLLFDSLQKLLRLGDQTILYPAHGAGSVCGDAMSDREFSTLGHERRHNPRLRLRDRDAFVAAKLAEHHEQPPYFRHMERLNSEGAPPARRVRVPRVLSAAALEGLREAVPVDVRGVTAFQGAHLPGSLALPVDMVPAFAGWFLEPGRPLVLVAEDAAQADAAALHLARIGLDAVEGCVLTALPAWAAGGGRFRSVPVVGVEEVARRVDADPDDWTLLDVRGLPEVREGRIPGARHAYVGRLPGELGALDRDRRTTVMCASGARATVGASLLLRAGFPRVEVFLGSMGAWRSAGHPVEKPAEPAG